MTREWQLVRRARTVRVMRPYLSRIVGRVFPPGSRLIAASTREVGQFSFKHALRYDLAVQTPPGRTARLTVRGNVPSRDTATESLVADRVQRALTRASFTSGVLRAPTSFGVVRPLRLHLYQHFAGITLESLIVRRDQRAIPTAYRAGQWLAKLHRVALRVSPARTITDIERDASYFRDDVARVAPPYLERAIRVLSATRRALIDAHRRYRRHARTIHGDLNLDNVIAGPDQSTGFIDFGNSLVFDPLSDVGNFFAQVDLLTWRGQCPRQLASGLQRAFSAGYRPAMVTVGPDATKRINLHRAWWSLQVLAYTLSIRPTVGRRIARLALATAEQLLTQAGYRIPTPLQTIGRSQLTAALHDQASMLAYFSGYLADFFPEATAVVGLYPEHHRALSTHSYLMRFRLILSLSSGTTTEKVIRGNRVDQATYKVMARVFRHRAGFASIRPLRYEPRLGYVFYEELAGQPLRQIPFRSRRFAQLMVRAGQTLAQFHRVPTPGLRRLTWTAERRFLRLLERRIHRSHPGSATTATRAWRALTRAEAPYWHGPRALVHNDFQASNIIATATGIGFIDFTQSGVGHPAIDLGTFRAHLCVMLHSLLPERAIHRLQHRFTQAYLRLQPTGHRQSLETALPTFELRGLLDILATTVTNLGPGDRNRRRYVRLLERRIDGLLAAVDAS